MPAQLKLLVAGPLHSDARDRLNAMPSLELSIVETSDLLAMVPTVYQADLLILAQQGLPEDVLARCDKLQFVATQGIDADGLPINALRERQIPLYVPMDATVPAIAEHTLMLLLVSARQLETYQAIARRQTDWELRWSGLSSELGGRTLLIVGFGAVGRRVSEIATWLGMKVWVFDRERDAAAHAPAQVQFIDRLDDYLPMIDFVSIHEYHSTQPLFEDREFGLLNPDAVLINTGSRHCVDEASLAFALHHRQLAFDAIDIFEAEPLHRRHPLLSVSNIVLTPHCAALTRQTFERQGAAIVDAINDYLTGELSPSRLWNATDFAGQSTLRPQLPGTQSSPQ